jgi:hypothetical protein
MTTEEIIAILEHHIEKLDELSDAPKEDRQFLQDAKEGTTDLLKRVKAGDESALQEIDDLLEMGCGP